MTGVFVEGMEGRGHGTNIVTPHSGGRELGNYGALNMGTTAEGGLKGSEEYEDKADEKGETDLASHHS